ncbi:putative toxin-antitoxin system toxin component, PIN family [Patescibacteria group bacterium]|nr:putative toxin-antitoxin system toxin component, PIN family [Patescibacteria group bacterium]MCL5010365.1 putative toxin-antitoxin system toxin component, PIN family [Patescibacteria group bacterium]
MITAVLDTNVLASGVAGLLLAGSVPGALLRRWHGRAYQLIVSEHLLAELTRTLTQPYFAKRLTPEDQTAALRLFRRQALLTPLTIPVQGIATHPEDDLILATALSGHAEYLVTGDRNLQDLKEYQGVRILSPRQFLDLLAREKTS